MEKNVHPYLSETVYYKQAIPKEYLGESIELEITLLFINSLYEFKKIRPIIQVRLVIIFRQD